MNTNLSTPQSSAIHSPIYIDGNAALDSFCSGNGTDGFSWETAHVIQDYEIDVGVILTAIDIRNTDRFLIIKNCTAYNSPSHVYGAGITIFMSSNVKITQCTVYSNYNGILIRFSNNTLITGNYASNNDRGISVYKSNNNSLTDNNASNNNIGISLSSSDYSEIISNNASYNYYSGISLSNSDYTTLISNNASYNDDYGIYLSYSNNNLMSFNKMIKCGLFISSSVNNSVDTTNLVNNKPVYYFQDEDGLIIDGGVFVGIGQLILINCNNSIISNLDLTYGTDGTIGISLSYANNNTLTGINLSSNKYGIYLDHSNNNTLTGNNLSSNEYGIYLSHSNSNMLTVNNLSSNEYGIYLLVSDYSELISNNLLNNDVGIYLHQTEYSELISNYVSNNNRDGIGLYNSNYNFIYQNDALNNNYNGILVELSDYNEIKGNCFSFNLLDGMRLIAAYYNEIIGNNLTSNDYYGIRMIRAKNNNIYFNNVEKNVVNEVLSDLNLQNNKWDNGILGNYWGNYVDFNPGAINDGAIWNTPYVIGYERDNFPLVQPFSMLHNFADFESNTTNPVLNANTVHFFFTGIIYDNIEEFQWNFGDGTVNSTEQDPVHVYSTYGNYTVTLTASNSTDIVGTIVKIDYIVYENLLPVVDFTSNTTTIYLNDNEVQFNFTGFEGDQPLSFQWNFGDGTINSTEINPIHSYLDVGNYTVILTVVDYNGDADVVTKNNYLILENLIPNTNFNADSTLIHLNDSNVRFNYTGSEGDSPLSFQWNFGDGTVNSTARNPVHSFVSFGNFTITLSVVDMNGDSDMVVKENYIIFENLLPVAEFSVDTISSKINELVLFSFIGSVGDSPTSYQWNFGDGTENSTLRNPGHVFTQVGNFMITLTVTDSNGDISSIMKESYIQVTSPDTNPTGNLLVTIGSIIGVCIAVGVTGIGVFAYKEKNRASLKVSKDGSEIKSVSVQIETLSNLFKMSKSVTIEDAALLTGLNKVEFLNFLVDNRSSLMGLTIEGDILTINTEEEVNEFIHLLDTQFKTWKNKEKSKFGKN